MPVSKNKARINPNADFKEHVYDLMKASTVMDIDAFTKASPELVKEVFVNIKNAEESQMEGIKLITEASKENNPQKRADLLLTAQVALKSASVRRGAELFVKDKESALKDIENDESLPYTIKQELIAKVNQTSEALSTPERSQLRLEIKDLTEQIRATEDAFIEKENPSSDEILDIQKKLAELHEQMKSKIEAYGKVQEGEASKTPSDMYQLSDGKNDNISIDKYINNDNFVNNERARNQVSESVSQGIERESASLRSQNKGYEDRLGERIRASEVQRQRPLDRYEKEDLERKTAFEHAKEHHLWVDHLHSLGDTPMEGGNENTLNLDRENGIVYKSNNLLNSKNSICQFFENIEGHNAIFPDKYEFVGFTGMENKGRVPYIEPIVKQDFIHDATQASQGEVESYMSKLGFAKVNDHTFKNDEYTVSDMRPRNVLKDPEGNMHVVDSIVERNKDVEKNQSAENVPNESITNTPTLPSAEIFKERINENKTEPIKPIGNENYKQGINQIEGREREIVLPDGTKLRGKYKIVSADDVVASHNEETFSKSENYPLNEKGETINDRDYEIDKSSQNRVVEIAHKFDGSAVQNTPVVTKDGVIVDGTARARKIEIPDNIRNDKTNDGRRGIEETTRDGRSSDEVGQPESEGLRRNDYEKLSEPTLEQVQSGNKEEGGTEPYSLSNEKDLHGNPFVVSQNGTTTFGEITPDIANTIGMPSAPIKLSEGNERYGAIHMDKHSSEIENAGFDSVESFVEFVTRNFNEIRRGNGNSLILIKRNGKNKSAFIRLYKMESEDIYSVASASILNNKCLDRRELLWSGKSSPTTDATTESDFQVREQQGSVSPSSPTDSSSLSDTKVANSNENSKPEPPIDMASRGGNEHGNQEEILFDLAQGANSMPLFFFRY